MNENPAIENRGFVQLRLDDDTLTLIAPAGGNEAQDVFAGSVSGIRSLFAQGRLTEAALEAAIAETEELVMPILRSLPTGARLKAGGPALAEVLGLLPESNTASVPIESVELLFNRLADFAGGSPVAWRHTHSPADLALGLVILREVMHHGGYRSVSLLPEAG